MAKKKYPFIGVYVDPNDPNIIRADMLDIYGNVIKSEKAICYTKEDKFDYRIGCEIAFNRLFDKEYVHPNEHCNTCKSKFKVGDRVKVVSTGEHYYLYTHFVETYCPHYLNAFSKGDEDFNKRNATGTVVYYHENDYGFNEIVYLVCFDNVDNENNLRYGLYNSRGIDKL